MVWYEIDNGSVTTTTFKTMSDMTTGVAGLNHRSEVEYVVASEVPPHAHTHTHTEFIEADTVR